MENRSIVAAGVKFDIGSRVVLWDEPKGLSFYKRGLKYVVRNNTLDELQSVIDCFVLHHAVSYTAKTTYNVLIGRGLSVNFIIDDDNVDGVATVYQCLDIKDYGQSQGHLNDNGPGVEIAYIPTAWSTPNAYSELNQKKMGVQPHEIVQDTIHGQNFKVFAPTAAQTNAVAALSWGICSLFNIPGEFPKDKDGNFIKGVVNLNNYRGLLNHFNVTRNKIDAAGLDLKAIEDIVTLRMQCGF